MNLYPLSFFLLRCCSDNNYSSSRHGYVLWIATKIQGGFKHHLLKAFLVTPSPWSARCASEGSQWCGTRSSQDLVSQRGIIKEMKKTSKPTSIQIQLSMNELLKYTSASPLPCDRNDAHVLLLIFIRPDLSERMQGMPRHNLMVLSTICASVAAAPNSSEACLATSLRPTSKASNALVTWPCSRLRNAKNFGVWCISMHFPQICQRNSLQRVRLPIYIV